MLHLILAQCIYNSMLFGVDNTDYAFDVGFGNNWCNILSGVLTWVMSDDMSDVLGLAILCLAFLSILCCGSNFINTAVSICVSSLYLSMCVSVHFQGYMHATGWSKVNDINWKVISQLQRHLGRSSWKEKFTYTWTFWYF